MPVRCPKISICMPTYNYGRFLHKTIESVLEQSFTDFELLIIDDCSQDESEKVLAAYAARDNRITVRLNERNIGMVPNWNACLQAARGTYVKYLFGDDFLSSPDALRKMVDCLDDDPSVSLVATARNMVNEQSDVISSLVTFFKDDVLPGTEVINLCLREHQNLIGEPTAVMFRREQAVRGFDARYRQIVDMEMWFYLLEQGRFAYITEPLVSFRLHDGQQTAKNLETMVVLDDYMLLFQEYLPRAYIAFNPAQMRDHVFTMFHKHFKYSRKNRKQRQLVKEKIRILYGTARFQRGLLWYKVRTFPMKVKQALTAVFWGKDQGC